jgi:hypothetical protein
MKKILLGALAIVLLFLVFVYFFIPSQIEFQVSEYVVVNPTAASRLLFAEKNWDKWWPPQNEKQPSDSEFHYKNASFTIERELYNAFKIDIVKREDSIHSILSLVPISADTTQLQWNALLNSTANPFKRMKKYWNIKETKAEMQFILSGLVIYLQNQENVYGMQIRREVVQDTLLVFKEKLSITYPTTSSIYEIVTELRDHIKLAGANETNPPMLNVIQLDQEKYRVMVAIPVDREFPVSDSLSFRRMVKGWILVSDIKGGPARIKQATIEMRNFVNDYSKIPIAVPFESMITDRIAERDTTKWTTRIYFPIVQ